jgi:mannose-1-phosphate guanylyltransferase
LTALIAEHRQSNADATMALMPMPPEEDYAAVETDGDGRVCRIAGRGADQEGLRSWHFPGVHVLTPAVFDFISPSGPEDINRDVYPRMIQSGRLIRGTAVEGYWSDVGTAGRYLQTQSDLLSGRVPLEAFAEASPFVGAQLTSGGYWTRGNAQVGQSEVRAPAFFDSGCTIASPAQLGPNAYVGCGAQVGPGAELVETAVLENTVLAANQRLLRTIAWGKGRLRG